MIDTSPDNINDTVLHTIFNAVNSKDRKSVEAVAHSIGNINNRLITKHIVQEPESSRDNIDYGVFTKLSAAENIIGERDLKVYLENYRVKKLSDMQAAKNAIQEAIKIKNAGIDIEDVLGK